MLSDRQLEVPERLQQRLGESLLGRADGALEDDEQVDVGMQAEQAPSVSPDRADDDRRTRVARGVAGQIPDDLVELRRVAALCRAPAPALARRGRQLGARGVERRMRPAPERLPFTFEIVHLIRHLVQCPSAS